MKKCLSCKQNKNIKEFHRCKRTSDGYKTSCKICRNKDRRIRYVANRSRELEVGKKWAEQNREKRREIGKRYYYNNWEKCRERSDNRKKIRYKTDEMFRLTHNLRTLINNGLKKKNFKKPKKSRTENIIGCSFYDLKVHLEKTFLQNYGIEFDSKKHKIQIDHIIPISFAKTLEDIIRLNHFSNLQYLLQSDNLKKKNNIDFVIKIINKNKK